MKTQELMDRIKILVKVANDDPEIIKESSQDDYGDGIAIIIADSRNKETHEGIVLIRGTSMIGYAIADDVAEAMMEGCGLGKELTQTIFNSAVERKNRQKWTDKNTSEN